MAIVTVEKNTYTAGQLYQWDLNQELEIYGLSLATIPEIHFTNVAMSRAIVRQASMDAAGVIRVDIPNSLLQKAHTISVYVCTYEGDTFQSLYKMDVPVKARTQPADYTLVDDPEVYSFNALENQVVNALAQMNTATAKLGQAKTDYDAAMAALNQSKDAYEQAVTEISDSAADAAEAAVAEKVGALTAGDLNAYTKEECITDDVKALFGFSPTATPNNVFNYLGKYAQYWWRRRFAGSHYEARTQTYGKYTLMSSDTRSGTATFQLADEVTVDQSTGAISLVNPTTLETTFDTNDSAFLGKYVKAVDGDTYLSGIYYIPAGSAVSHISNIIGDGDKTFEKYAESAAALTSVSVSDTGEWEYLQASTEDAYPKEGTVGNVEYEFIGIPFDNTLVLPPEVIFGTYVGTGAYGASNPNTLTFDKVPKVVLLSGMVQPLVNGVSSILAFQSNEQSKYVTVSWSGKTVSWYHQSNAGYQCNTSAVTYNYVAIL